MTVVDTANMRQEIAHVLRRTSFGPFPGGVDAALAVSGGAREFLDRQLAQGPLPFEPPGDIDSKLDNAPESLGPDQLISWWINRMCTDEAGLHERMMWFWHTHFTTSADKATGLLCWRQLRTFHEHALGNFGDLATAMTIDGAMLQYLDGDGSDAAQPNENFARELMELSTMGHGTFKQSDVVAGAKALAGWAVNWETSHIDLVPDRRMRWPVRFLGKTRMYTTRGIVDQILAQPVTAPFIVGKLWDHFIGTDRNAALIDSWAQDFRRSNYEIRPLVETMLRSDAFWASRLSRPRSAVEWFCGVIRATGHREFNPWDLHTLGQVPYHPPNVAGWPDSSRWVSATSLLARGEYLTWFEIAEADLVGRNDDAVSAALAHCGVEEVGDTTRSALTRLDRTIDRADYTHRGMTLLRAVFLTPEFSLL